jgi:hypothetical protein
MLSVILLNVTCKALNAVWCYAECHYAERRGALTR